MLRNQLLLLVGYLKLLPELLLLAQLEELFSTHGQVQSAKVIGDKGFGFVEMSSSEEAEKAMEALNETEFGGRTLRVNEARPQKERTDRRY